jgi:hypothetical protein
MSDSEINTINIFFYIYTIIKHTQNIQYTLYQANKIFIQIYILVDSN